MTSLHNIWFSKLHILQNLIEAISLPNSIALGCLNQILRGMVENIPPQTYTLSKSPVIFGLRPLLNQDADNVHQRVKCF